MKIWNKKLNKNNERNENENEQRRILRKYTVYSKMAEQKNDAT